ncbi:hypothetical protein HGM15179_020512, partial [Zosterops borbonicus]
LFLRRKKKWSEVTYADMFFSLRNHPEWQRDCGMRPPSDPLVLALEKDNKATKGKPKRCCSTCSINQRCTHPDKVYQERRRVVENADSGPPLTPTSPTSSSTATKLYPPLPSSDTPKLPPQGPIASRTQKQTRRVIQAPLRQAMTSDGETKRIKVPFSSIDLEIWEKSAKGYQSDPIGVAKKMKFIIKQHLPDWADQLVLKVDKDLAENDFRTTQEDVKDVFPLQDPDEELGQLRRYQELIVKGLERAIPKTINWSALYAVKQGPSQTPSEFLDHLRDAMRRHTTLDPESNEGTQQLINLFLRQSTEDIRRKLQKIRGPDIFSNREEGYKQRMKKLVAEAKEREKGKHRHGPPKQGPSRLGKNQCAFCRKTGHWKNQCPELRK